MSKINLNTGWALKEAPLNHGKDMAPLISRQTEGWYSGLSLPLDVRMPLIEAGVIKDPVLSDYFFESEWVEQRSWWFKKDFQVSGKSPVMELVIESLDIHGDVFLNGIHLGHHESAFFPFRREVSEYLTVGTNTLLVRLSSGLEYVSDTDVAEIDFLVSIEGVRDPTRGDKRRVFLRKPAYVYGWDWCPRIATIAIAKNAYIECADAAIIRGVSLETVEIGAVAKLRAKLEIELLDILASADGDIALSLSYEGKAVTDVIVPDVLLRSGINYIDMDINVENPQLWWPNGMGGQPLYDVSAAVTCRGKLWEYPLFKYGIRIITLDTSRVDAENRKFELLVNGFPIFCKGGDWIPSDSIYARVSPEKYDFLVQEAKEANFNMLRIWGGGIYERDEFYDACDKAGIMVWQDIMFACGTFPDHIKDFYALVGHEVDYQTKRLRNRACLAMFCGNNEIPYLYGHMAPLKPEKQYGHKIQNIQIPEYIQKNCRWVPYWNSSPYGGETPNSPKVGNVHHWNNCTMHPEMARRIEPKEYDKVQARFVSEYGYIGPSTKESIERYFDGKPICRDSSVWNYHNNTFEKQTVAAGIKKHYTDKELSLDEYLLYAGLAQSLMLGYSLESLRFKDFCGGGLFWMFNDTWGETGWTIVDYYLRRKIAYYGVRRAFEPVKLIMREAESEIMVMGCNDTAHDISFDLRYGYVGFDGNGDVSEVAAVTIPARSRKMLVAFKNGSHNGLAGIWYAAPQNPEVRPAILRHTDYRQLKIAPPKVKAIFENHGEDLLAKLSAETYCHAVYLDTPADVHLSDNYIDLLPGECREIIAKGQAGKVFDVKIGG